MPLIWLFESTDLSAAEKAGLSAARTLAGEGKMAILVCTGKPREDAAKSSLAGSGKQITISYDPAAEHKPAEGKVRMKDATSFTMAFLSINAAVKSADGKAFVYFDTVTDLMKSDMPLMINFVNSLAGILKTWGVEGIFVAERSSAVADKLKGLESLADKMEVV